MLTGNNNGTIGAGACPATALLSLIPGIQIVPVAACGTAGVMCAIGNLNAKWKQ